MRRRTATKILGMDVPTATAEDTIIAKLEWGTQQGASDRQLEDVAGIAGPRGRSRLQLIERWVPSWGLPSRGSESAQKWVDDPGGSGPQIVRELRACEQCFAKRAAIERQREPSPVERHAA
jgi:hypothetical protein